MAIGVHLELLVNHKHRCYGFYMRRCPCCYQPHVGVECKYTSPIECLDFNGTFKCLFCEIEFLLTRYEYGLNPNASVEIVKNLLN